MKSRQQGMTLLELLIVLAIVGILAAIAVPSFNDSVMKARRADARRRRRGLGVPSAEAVAARRREPRQSFARDQSGDDRGEGGREAEQRHRRHQPAGVRIEERVEERGERREREGRGAAARAVLLARPPAGALEGGRPGAQHRHAGRAAEQPAAVPAARRVRAAAA